MQITYCLLSDIHANHTSLKIAFEIIDKLGVDKTICIGDVLGYGGAPNEVISFLRKRRIQTILGNHDFYFLFEMVKAGMKPKCTILQDLVQIWKKMLFRPPADELIKWELQKTTKTNMEWISRLPIALKSSNNELFAIHGAPTLSARNYPKIKLEDYFFSLMKYLFPWEMWEIALHSQMQPANTMIVGHSHIQFAQQTKKGAIEESKVLYPCLMKFNEFPVSMKITSADPLVINPGSIGQSRDEVHAPGFATITFRGKKTKIITWYRYTYPFQDFLDYLEKVNAPKSILGKSFWGLD